MLGTFDLQRCVKDDQFGAGWDGIVAGVTLHEVHVNECVGLDLWRRAGVAYATDK